MTNVLVGNVLINSSLCDTAQYLSTSDAVQIVQWIEIVLDIVALSSLTYFIRTKDFRKVAKVANTNMKIIGLTGIFFYYVAILFSTIRLYTAKTSCDFLWYPMTCIIFRLPVYYCFICFSLFHFTLFIERAICTFCKYQLNGCRFGVSMSFLIISLSALVTAIPLSTDNFTDLRTYCFSNSKMSPEIVVICMGGTLLIDIFVTIGDIYIYLYNKKSLNNKHQTSNYNLSNAFRLRETQLSMNIIFPFASIHAAIFLLYLLSVIAPNFVSFLSSLDKTSAVLQLVSITKSIYLAGVPLLTIVFVRGDNSENWLEKQRQIPVQSYFDQFNQQVIPQRIIPLNKAG